MINELLPIGSVVTLKGGNKKIMVFGIKQSDNVETKEEYDYIGVLYPEGNVGLEYQFLFNHKDIDTIHFKGYENDEWVAFIHKLYSLYENNDEQMRMGKT